MSAQASVLPTLQAARVTIYLRLFSELKVTNDHLPQVLFIRAAMKKHVNTQLMDSFLSHTLKNITVITKPTLCLERAQLPPQALS